TYFYALLESRNFEKANIAVSALQRRGKLEPADYLKLGDLNYSLKREDEALSWYQKALQEDSTSCDPYFNVGSIYMRRQDYASAAEMFEKRIECDSRSLAAYINAGASYLQLKNNERARQLFLKTIELRPDLYLGRIWLARAYTQMDSLEEAVNEYNKVLELIGDPPPADKKKDFGEANFLRGSLFFIKQQYARSIEAYRKALSVGYETDGLYLSYGQAQLLTLDPKGDREENRKKVEDAVKAFRKSISLNQSNAQAHLWLAQGLVQSRIEGENELNKGLTDEACAELAKTQKLDPRSEEAKKLSVRIGCK
ncbi:MAG: tetratricopeptide repeat protein, partial [Ignavibacteria bacterium]|nr:tetratricopeptide repeat protein [Ignavibacteria bacterium]